MQTWTNRKHIRRIDHALPRWDWQDPIDEWMRWQLAVGRSKETLRTRWYQLERFSRITDKPIRDVTADDVIGYFILAEERESGTSLSTKRGVRTSLNAFYKWCIKRGIAERNPIDDVPVIPLGVPAGLICPEHAIDEAIKSEDDMTVDMVMLGAWMGLRRIEIASIDLAQDIEDNPDEMRLRVHGKGRKERVLPVPGELARRLRRRPVGYLFPGRFGGRVSVDFVGDRIKAATGWPSHSLRRRFATVAYYRSGCNILLVSQMLGHSSVGTTMHYIGLNAVEMRQTVESVTRTDPLAHAAPATPPRWYEPPAITAAAPPPQPLLPSAPPQYQIGGGGTAA